MRIFRMLSPGPVWEGEGGGAGGGGAAAAAAAAAAAGDGAGGGAGGGNGGNGGAGAGGAGGAGGAAAWTPPKDLAIPGDFLGATAEETLGKMVKGYGELNTRAEGLRTQLAGKPGAPEKPESYTFKPADEVAKYFGDVEKHPAMAVARTAAHKHGLSQTQYEGFINDVYGELAKNGGLAEPYDAMAEVKGYAEASGLDAKTVSQHFSENDMFAKGLIAQLTDLPPKLAQQAQAELTALTDTAGGNALIRALASRLAESGIRIAGEGHNANGPLSDADLDKLTADPRIDPRNENHKDPAQRYDPNLRQRYTDGMAARGRKKYGAAS